jgi:hypothetical protein
MIDEQEFDLFDELAEVKEENKRLQIKVYQLENELALTRAMLPTGYKYEVVRIEND